MKTKHFICENPSEGQCVEVKIGDCTVTLIAQDKGDLCYVLAELCQLGRAKHSEHTFHCPASRVSPAKKGDDLYRVALTRRQALDKANTIIVSSRKWYLGVKENYSKNPEPGFFGGMPNFTGR